MEGGKMEMIHPVKPLYSYKELKQKMRNLPGRVSSELEIVPGRLFETRKAEIEEHAQTQRRVARQATILFGHLIDRMAQPIIFALGEVPKADPVVDQGITIRAIIFAVCKHFCLDRTDLISNRRTKNLTVPRHIASYLARSLTKKSYPEIGRYLGGRDHTTIMHSDQMVTKWLTRGDDKIRDDIWAITAILRAS
jgi:chromosomal replication initiation ATPase DnaA